MDTNILSVFVKYIIAYALIFITLPCFIFQNIKQDITKNIVSNYIKLSFWIIVLGYITIIIKLYEIITFFIIAMVFIFYKYYKRYIQSGDYRLGLGDKFQIIVINHADNVERVETIFFRFIRDRFNDFITKLYYYFKIKSNVYIFLIATGVFTYLGYQFFYDSLNYVAPSTNESFPAIIAMKSLGSSKLFYESIYPQGFYIVLQTMQRLFKIDPIFIINFANGLYSLFILFGIYFFVSRVSGNKFSGIIAVVIYGVMRNHFSLFPDVLNLASPNQFAFLFLYPVLYFYYQHIQTSNLSDLYSAAIGSALIGLIHPMAFLCLAIGIVALLIANFLRNIRTLAFNLINVVIIMLLAFFGSIIPIFIGFLYNKSLSTDLLNIITETNAMLTMPAIKIFDLLGIVSLATIFISLLFYIFNKSKFIERAWIFLFGLFSFFIYLYGGAMTQSKYLQLGSDILWHMLIPVVIAFAFVTITDVLNTVIRFKYLKHIICATLTIVIFFYFPLTPIITQKRDSENLVAQYIKINRMYRPTQWVTVSWEEGFAYALESGFHIQIDDFIDKYNPSYGKLLNIEDNYKELKAKDIFIFYHKRIAIKNLNVQEKMYRMDKNNRLKSWIDTYTRTHNNLNLYYEDDEIKIWHIHQEPSRKEMQEILWEN